MSIQYICDCCDRIFNNREDLSVCTINSNKPSTLYRDGLYHICDACMEQVYESMIKKVRKAIEPIFLPKTISDSPWWSQDLFGWVYPIQYYMDTQDQDHICGELQRLWKNERGLNVSVSWYDERDPDADACSYIVVRKIG
jgi:hypothetical protein